MEQTEQKLNDLEQKIGILSNELNSLKDLIVASFTKVQNNFSVIERRLSALETGVNDLNFKVRNLDKSTSSGLSDVGNKIESLTDEISKINTVTQYNEMYNNQQGLKKGLA